MDRKTITGSQEKQRVFRKGTTTLIDIYFAHWHLKYSLTK